MTLEELASKVSQLEDKLDVCATKLTTMENQGNTIRILVQWVITPLLVILGGLVGVKLVLP